MRLLFIFFIFIFCREATYSANREADDKNAFESSGLVSPHILLRPEQTFNISLKHRKKIMRQARDGDVSSLLVLMLFNPRKTRDDPGLLVALQQKFELLTPDREKSLYYLAASLLLSKISSPTTPSYPMFRDPLRALMNKKRGEGEFIPACIRFVWARDALDAAIANNTTDDEAYNTVKNIGVLCQSLRGIYYYLYFTYHAGYNEAFRIKHGELCQKPDLESLTSMIAALKSGGYPRSAIYHILREGFLFSQEERVLIMKIFPPFNSR